MEKAILDLTECKYLLEMHERIKSALVFLDYYGQNWSAFWDWKAVLDIKTCENCRSKHGTVYAQNESPNYYRGKRNGHRVLWSNDGLMFVTYNHYLSFIEVIGG